MKKLSPDMKKEICRCRKNQGWKRLNQKMLHRSASPVSAEQGYTKAQYYLAAGPELLL